VEARGQGLVSAAYWALEAYATLMARTMRAEAAGGEVVLIGRAGNEALRGVPGVLHVLVVGAQQRRIQRLMAAEGLTGYKALDRVREDDRNRRAFVRQIWGADWLDPRRYDLCLNTDDVSVEQAAAVVTQAARARRGRARPGPLRRGRARGVGPVRSPMSEVRSRGGRGRRTRDVGPRTRRGG
jgi:hypothetical protein